jgi:hypothetical protein
MSEEVLNALEDIYERILARNNVLCRLCGFNIRTVLVKGSSTKPTERRTPAPAKMTFVGENTISEVRSQKDCLNGIHQSNARTNH